MGSLSPRESGIKGEEGVKPLPTDDTVRAFPVTFPSKADLPLAEVALVTNLTKVS